MLKKKIIYIFLIVFTIFILFYLYYLIIDKQDSWVLGDWLINYQDGGFKRRGILGSILIEINKLIHIRLDVQVFIINSFLWLCYIFFFYKLIKGINISWGLFFLILSPVFLLFNISSTSSIGRKEVLLFFIFSFWVYLTLFKKIDKKVDCIFLLALSFLIFVHELVLFYVPYFFIFYYVKNKRLDIFSLTALLIIIINSLIIYNFGGEINQGNTFNILKSCGLEIKNEGILNVKSNVSYINYYLANLYTHLSYIIVYVLYLLFSLKILNNSIDKRYFDIRMFFIVLILSQIFILPLFYLATDWGRWININFTFIALLIIYFQNKFNLKTDSFNNIYAKTFGILCMLLQIETCGLGLKLNYFLEILLSKI